MYDIIHYCTEWLCIDHTVDGAAYALGKINGDCWLVCD